MKNANSLFELRKRISEKVLLTSKDNLFKIRQKCVDENRFTFPEIINITTGQTPIDALSEQQLYWLLEYSNIIIKGLGKAEDYFNDAEIKSHKFYQTEMPKPITYPLTFKGVTCLTPESTPDKRDKKQFGFYLTVEYISKLKSNGILQVVPELQRSGKRDSYGELKTKVNPKRRESITDAIHNGDFYYNSIRISLIDEDNTEWNYDDVNDQIIVNKGTLITPDGNHRAVACEFVEKDNIHATDKFHVLFTVLTPPDTKKVISQEWNTEPVNKVHQRSMQPTTSNQIVDAINRSPDFDDMLKKNIVTTGLQIKSGEGFIIYSVLAGAIEKYYNSKTAVTKQEQNEIARWLIEFLNNIVYIYKEDFLNFKEVRKNKWNVNPYAFVGFVMLSKYLNDRDNWRDELLYLLKQINFTNMNEFRKNKAEKAYVKYVENIFEDVIKNAYKRQEDV